MVSDRTAGGTWQTGAVARRSTTVALDEEVFEDLHAAARRLGVTEDQLVEDAIRRYVGMEILDELWTRARLTPEEAESVAAEELQAYRAERRAS